MMRKLINIVIAYSFVFAVTGCQGQGGKSEVVEGDTLTTKAQLLTIVDCG